MTTKIPTQRTHRETRIEPAHVESAFTQKPAVHFQLTEHAPPSSAVEPFHAPHKTGIRLLTHLSQIVKTTLPLGLADCAGLALSLGTATAAVTYFLGPISNSLSPLVQVMSEATAFVLIYSLLGLYSGVGLNPIIELRSLAWGTLTSGAALFLLAGALGHWTTSQIVFVFAATCLQLFVAPLMRCFARGICSQMSWWGQPAIVIGSSAACQKLIQTLRKKTSFGLRPIGMVLDRGDANVDEMDADCLGTITDLPALVHEHAVFWALIAPENPRKSSLAETLQYCQSIPNVVMIPGFEEFPSLWNRTQDLGGVLGICFRERLLDPWSQFGKRTFDITAVLLGTLILSPFLVPLLAFTWVCMKITSPGPIFYGQERVGKDGTRFQAWKFRTMVLNAENALKVYLQKHPEKKIEWDLNQKLRQDPRIIPGIGNFLRKTSLDELPQLWNVLIGDMSLVGPRPFMTEQTEIYGDRVSLYHKVRPGITGLWQISGRNHTTFEERGKYDAYYVRNWSFWLDIFILGRTVKTVLFREGAF